MNRHCYRVVFNAARGLRMAVAEYARCTSRARSNRRTYRNPDASFSPDAQSVFLTLNDLRPIALSTRLVCGTLFGLLLPASAHAQIFADPNAPANQRPTVVSAANGTPVVNIQTPNAAGLSHNTYRQLDGGNIVFNNSRTDVQSQVGGWVQGNPWLATGTARTILNEVNSSNPSLLTGALEVAGDRAQLIIANPAGITCNGCSFINASTGTLTTGTPVINNGNLESYRVTRGTLTIGGNGLDARQTDYTDLIARAVVVNAGIWANQLRVSTGSSEVSTDSANSQNAQPTPIAGSGSAPAFAIDVAQLGGMYAGKITLIGSETGLGVRNAGQIGASAGEVIVTVDGRLENSGAIYAQGTQGNTRLTSTQDIVNTGSIAAQGNTTLTASQIASSANSFLAAGLQSDNSFGASGDLTLHATQAINANGQNLAAGDLVMSGSAIDLSGSQTQASNVTLVASQNAISTASATVLATQTFRATANANSAQKLDNRQGQIAAGQLDLHLANLDNTDGVLIQSSLGDTTIALSAQASLFDNTRGYFGTNSQNLNIVATTFTNTDGQIEHSGSGTFTLDAPSFSNLRGSLLSNGAFSLTSQSAIFDSSALQADRLTITADTFSNRSGSLLQTGSQAGSIVATALFDNTGGNIQSNGMLTLGAGLLLNNTGYIGSANGQSLDVTVGAAFDNTQGSIIAADALTVHAASLNNDRGTLQATQGNATFTLSGDFANTLGNVYAGQTLQIDAASLSNSGSLYALGDHWLTLTGALGNTATIAAFGDIHIGANRLDASASSLLGAGLQANPDGSFSALGHGSLSVITTQVIHAYGQNLATNDLSLNGSGIDLSGSITAAGNDIDLTAQQGDLTATNAYLTAGNAFTATVAGTLDNDGATLAANQDLRITANRLSGIGSVSAGRDAWFTLTSDYTNAAGNQMQVGRDLHFSTSGAFANQTDLLAVRTLTLSAATIDNPSNVRIESADTHLTASSGLNNRGLIGGDTLEVSAPTLNNTSSIMGGVVTLYSNDLTNQGSGAVIAATDVLNLWVQNSVRNLGGAMLYSLGDLNIGAQAQLDGNGYLVPGLARLLNQSSSIEAGGILRISADQIVNERTVFNVAWSAPRNGPFVNFDVPGTSNDLHYTPTYITEYVTADTTPAARMTSGGDMWLGGNLNNRYSAIASGANLYYNAANLSNTARALMETETDNGVRDNWQYVVVGEDCWSGAFGGLFCSDIWGWRNFQQPYYAQTTYQIGSVDAPITARQSFVGTPLTFLNQTVTGSGGTVGNLSTTRIDANSQAPVSVPIRVPGQTVAGPNGALPDDVLPDDGLFKPNPDPNIRALIETDPRFADYRQWRSSDYMLQKLNQDPATAQKRLGDGFYEQKVVREQIASLTGRRFLDNYSDDETQYAALMDQGVTVAQAWNLRPGIALSATQMASLTSDIVWLVSQTVTLADGSQQDVLVPVVYLARINADALNPSGALIAAADVNLQVAGMLQNSGNIKSDTSTVLAAADLLNRGGLITSGGNTILQASNDILNQSGTIRGQRIALSAGRDIVSERLADTLQRGAVSATRVHDAANIVATGSVQAQAGRDLRIIAANVASGSDIQLAAARNMTIDALATQNSTRNASGAASQTVNLLSQVQSGGNLALAAGQDATLRGAQLQSAQDTQIVAGGNVQIAAVKDSAQANFNSRSNTNRRYDETVVGSQIQAGGKIDIAAIDLNNLPPTAAGNITVEGSALNASGALNLSADNSVSVKEVSERHEFNQQLRSQKSGFLSSTKITTSTINNHSDAIGSSLGGDTVNIEVGKDLNVRGSNVVSDRGTTLTAGNDITIEAATNTQQQSQRTTKTTGGVMGGGGIGFTVGTRGQSLDQQGVSTTAAVSTIGSVQGDIDIHAGNAYRQIGSAVNAPVGDITIGAKTIDIVEARETSQSSVEQKFRQSGLSVSVTNPVISALQTGQQMNQAAKQTDDPRMKALAAGTTALAGKGAYDAVAAGQGGNPVQQAGGLNVSVNIGASSSQSKTTSRSDSAAGSSVNAGGDVVLSAAGAGAESTLTVQGSDIKAGNNVRLDAEGEIKLLAAKNTAEQHSTNKSSSGSIGVGFALGGTQNGLTINASVSQARGNADGKDVSWSNTHVEAGNQVMLNSGTDTTLRGAVVKANQVVANVGTSGAGDLKIESLQDTSTFDSKQSSTGVGVSLCIPPLCAGLSGASVSVAKSTANSNYASVTEQSGIQAGDKGFQIAVAGNTELKGAVIASTDKAVQDNKNQLTTQTLTTSDIQNQASYSASSTGVTLGVGSMASSTSAGVGKASGSAASTTASGISGNATGASITITNDAAQQAKTGQTATEMVAGVNSTVRTGDSANGIGKIFDVDKVQRDINAQVRITQAFSQQASQAVKSYAATQRKSLQDQLKNATNEKDKAALQQQLKNLTMQERVMNILVGAVTGNLGAAATKEGLSAAAEQMRQFMIDDSKKFAGITDGKTTLSNVSGKSEGVRGDGQKIGGTRVDLDIVCGAGNERCKTYIDANGNKQLQLVQGQVIFNPEGAGGKSLAEFLETPEGQKASGPTGGIQGAKGTLFSVPYAPGSWQDQLIESFSGTHDMIGGKISGLYDAQGNATRGRSTTQVFLNDRWAEIAIPLSAPFAASELLSPAVWNAISILIKEAK